MDDIVDAIVRALPERATLLDAGVGTGRFAEPLRSRDLDVTGTDISARMLGKAREKRIENLVQADLCQLPFVDDAFEAALSVHVLHLIIDWRCALSEIGRVTSQKLLSIAFDKKDSPAERIGDFYESACADLGFRIRHPGVRERELSDRLPADSHTIITVHEQPVDVRDMIENYASKAFSNQWPVPEDIHARAVDRLREEYRSVNQVVARERISLIEWNIGRVRAFLSKTAGSGG